MVEERVRGEENRTADIILYLHRKNETWLRGDKNMTADFKPYLHRKNEVCLKGEYGS